MLNWLPWQAQLILPSLTLATWQAMCVHVASNALNVPVAGWVITKF